MQALTAKSKKALLVFLSFITLTLVLTVSLPSRIYPDSSRTAITQSIVRRELRKIVPVQLLAFTFLFTALFALPKIRPWTGDTHPRAPPTA